MLASELLCKAIVREGKFAQSIPSYGFERRGAPLESFVKLDDQPIRERTQVYEPDGVLVLDPSLIKQVPVFQGVKPGAFAVLNTRKKIGLEELPSAIEKLAFIDANRVALEVFRAPITNTVMLGALASATGLVTLESLLVCIADFFPERLVDKNLQAVKRGYEEVSVVNRRTSHGKVEWNIV